jgi:hypothetical protein
MSKLIVSGQKIEHTRNEYVRVWPSGPTKYTQHTLNEYCFYSDSYTVHSQICRE